MIEFNKRIIKTASSGSLYEQINAFISLNSGNANRPNQLIVRGELVPSKKRKRDIC